MIDGERSIVKAPSITKEAKAFNALAIDDTIQGMKKASILERQVREAEIEKAEAEAIRNQVEQEIPIPTGDEIRADFENGEYR